MSAVARFALSCGLSVFASAACHSGEVAVAPDHVVSQTIGSGQATYVLDRVEQQVGAPIVLVDLACTSGRVRHLVQDTIVLSADGGFRRAFVLSREQGGVRIEDSYNTSSGTWSAVGSDVAVQARLQNGQTLLAYHVRLRDDRNLSMEGALGGSCPGAVDKSRSATFTYRRLP